MFRVQTQPFFNRIDATNEPGEGPAKSRTSSNAAAHSSPEPTVINPRLVNLLASFIGGTSAYALARLELALTFPAHAAPPLLDRLPDASEQTLRQHWDRIESQFHGIVDYVKQIEADPRGSQRSAAAFTRLERTVRELDQYARALRWVMTVTEHNPADDPTGP